MRHFSGITIDGLDNSALERSYSAIFDIIWADQHIDWSSRFESEVEHDLLLILFSRSGSLILDEITRHITLSGHSVIIQPLDDMIDPVSIHALEATGAHATNLTNAFRRGQQTIEMNGTLRTETGTGLGSDSTVFFLPFASQADFAMFFDSQRRLHDYIRVGGTEDAILLHELIHSLGHLRGLTDRSSISAIYRGEHSYEEFKATLITNIYRSEIGSSLRGPYATHELESRTSEEYCNCYRDDIDLICSDYPELTRNLAAVSCNFNPFRIFYNLT